MSARGKFLLVFFSFGIMSLSYLLGAAVIVYELPSSDFLRKAFAGAKAKGKGKIASRSLDPQFFDKKNPGKIDNPDKTFDGFTLVMFASVSVPGTQAFLFDMNGTEVHKWSVPFREVWPNC